VQRVQTEPARLIEVLRRVVVAPPEVLGLVVATAIAPGHLLLEDVPGVGKTLLAKTLAAALGLGFRRIQFSPDLLPGDLTGIKVYLPNDGSFRFVPGPIFTPVLLADEINRATPRTQAGLLEAMEEAQVSIDGETFSLPDPFFVVATQNPATFDATYPLPEAQLDRFTASLTLGYPSYDDEKALLEGRHGEGIPISPLPPDSLGEWRTAARAVHVDPSLRDYLLAIVRMSRQWPDVRLGISPRGALAWQSLARARAFVEGRGFLVPDDLKQTALPALAHRLLLEGDSPRDRREAVLRDWLERTPVPR
jgi:MoxR-like ATPase